MLFILCIYVGNIVYPYKVVSTCSDIAMIENESTDSESFKFEESPEEQLNLYNTFWLKHDCKGLDYLEYNLSFSQRHFVQPETPPPDFFL